MGKFHDTFLYFPSESLQRLQALNCSGSDVSTSPNLESVPLLQRAEGEYSNRAGGGDDDEDTLSENSYQEDIEDEVKIIHTTMNLVVSVTFCGNCEIGITTRH